MRNLVLLTTYYPYGINKESFLETEINYLASRFDEILIIATKPESVVLRKIPVNVFVRQFPGQNLAQILSRVIFKNFRNIIRFMLPEVRREIRSDIKLIILKFIEMLKHIIKALLIKEYIVGQLDKGDQYLIYSYWFNGAALAAGLLNKEYTNVRAISRLHGWDLYTESHPTNYFPFQREKALLLDRCIFISNQGKNYFEHKYGTLENYLVSKLGTINSCKPILEAKDLKLHIVSCSSLHRGKRVNYIIESLALISEITLRWTHIGGGELFNELTMLAQAKLGGKDNVEFNFLGNLSNEYVIKFYNENYIHLFINTSMSEGIPVSIMEAMSFGIPIIATDVGGTSEIVDSTCGILLENECNYHDIKSAILEINSKYSHFPYRQNAYSKWEQNFNGEINYRNFIEEICSLK